MTMLAQSIQTVVRVSVVKYGLWRHRSVTDFWSTTIGGWCVWQIFGLRQSAVDEISHSLSFNLSLMDMLCQCKLILHRHPIGINHQPFLHVIPLKWDVVA
jgi:hypothetical protein